MTKANAMNQMKRTYFLTISLLLLGITGSFSQSISTHLAPLKYRNIGPFRGGRANAGTGVVGDPLTYYMGTTGGGLWKTTDAGQHWNNVSDGFFKLGSVGAVAVSQSDPNIVYVGMGEHAPRGVMTSHGDGVYKSTDAGKTWKQIGLEKTQHISRIIIHPNNPDILQQPSPQHPVVASSQQGNLDRLPASSSHCQHKTVKACMTASHI